MKSQLEQFYQRRRTATTALAAAVFQQSFLLGSSVVASALLKEFTSSKYGFNGLYALALTLFVSYWVGSEIIMPLYGKYPSMRDKGNMALFILFPCSYALAGVSAKLDSTALLYIAFTGVMGISLSVYDVFTKYEVLQWWGPDGQKRVGVAILGLCAGGSAIFFTLLSGWVIVPQSLETCLYVLAAVQALFSTFLVYMVSRGNVDSPPSVEEVQSWLGNVDDMSNGTDQSRPVRPSHIEEQSQSLPQDDPRPIGTTHLIPVRLENRLQAFRYPIVYLILLKTAANTFNGYATKVLLSSMYELVFSLPTMTAAYLSALSLVLFWIGRAAVPYYLLDSKYPATILSAGATGVSAIAYGILPAIVGKEELGPELSWRLVGFVLVKSVISGTFACNMSLMGSQMYDLVGSTNLSIMFRLSWPMGGTTGTAGPIVAYILTIAQRYQGKTYSEAFSAFFYLSAGLAFMSTVLTGGMHLLLKRGENPVKRHSSSSNSGLEGG